MLRSLTWMPFGMTKLLEGSARLGREVAADEPREEVQGHDDEDEGQRSRPRAVDAHATLRVLAVREHGQRHHATVEQVPVHLVELAHRDEQRRRLTDHARDREHDPRDDARRRGTQHDLDDREPLGHPERVGHLTQLVRHEAQHLLDRADHDGRHEHRERDSAHDARTVRRPEDQREQREGEQSRDDRRDSGHDVHEERDRARERATPVLDEVDRGEQPDRDRDERRRPGHQERPDDRVHRTALGHLAEDAHHVGRQERDAEQAQPARDDDPHERDERDHREAERRGHRDPREPVGRTARPLDRAREHVERHGVQHDRERDDGRDRGPRAEGADREGHRERTGAHEPRRAGGQAPGLDVPLDHQRSHQFAPEKSLRRATMARATKLTTKVITNSASPVAMSTETLSPAASGNWAAMFAAIVWCWPGLSRKNENSRPGDRTIRTAIVSPRARPRPSIAAEITPERPNGRTAVRIISQRVAPSASAASSCRRGVWRNTSRATAVMIGRIMTASTTAAVRTFFAGAWYPAKIGMNPSVELSHVMTGSSTPMSHSAPHSPYTTEGIAASRSTR